MVNLDKVWNLKTDFQVKRKLQDVKFAIGLGYFNWNPTGGIETCINYHL